MCTSRHVIAFASVSLTEFDLVHQVTRTHSSVFSVSQSDGMVPCSVFLRLVSAFITYSLVGLRTIYGR